MSDTQPTFTTQPTFATQPRFPTDPLITCKGLWFNGKEVHIDGYCFENCRFDNCQIISNSGNFQMVNCYIDNISTIMHGTSNVRVIQLFHRSNRDMSETNPIFVPKFNNDGTITID